MRAKLSTNIASFGNGVGASSPGMDVDEPEASSSSVWTPDAARRSGARSLLMLCFKDAGI
jgi:hypothetical protein